MTYTGKLNNRSFPSLAYSDFVCQSAPTRLICLENTLDGLIFPQGDITEISEFAHKNDILMHLDGARLWHVAAETRTELSKLCEPFDSVSLCFSKGLGAPIGTCLVGSKAFIRKVRWFRKLFGGGMRQTGILAGAAAYALTHNFPKIPRVHALTRRLQRGLQELGVDVTCPVETCMVRREHLCFFTSSHFEEGVLQPIVYRHSVSGNRGERCSPFQTNYDYRTPTRGTHSDN